MVESDITIERDPTYVDCYLVTYSGVTHSVTATAIGVLAETVAARGDFAAMAALQALRDADRT